MMQEARIISFNTTLTYLSTYDARRFNDHVLLPFLYHHNLAIETISEHLSSLKMLVVDDTFVKEI